MKKIRILGLLLASCFFFACNGITTDDNNISYKINSEKATLSFSVNSLERIVRPTAVDFTKAEVLYRKTAETGTAADYKELKTWTVKTISGDAGTTTQSPIEQMTTTTEEIVIDFGTYDFLLNLYTGDETKYVLMQQGALLKQEVTAGENSLAFTTKYTDGIGKLKITFNWDSSLEITKVKVGMFSFNTNTGAIGDALEDTTAPDGSIESYGLEECAISTDSGTGIASVSYTKDYLKNGYYYYKFFAYAGETALPPLTDVVRIVAELESAAVISYTTDNKVYSVTYDLSDGEWTSGYTPTTSRNVNIGILLPTKANVSKPGMTFDGWYEKAADGSIGTERIYAIGTGTETAKNYSFVAKWIIPANGLPIIDDGILNISCNGSLYMNKSCVTLSAKNKNTGDEPEADSIEWAAALFYGDKNLADYGYKTEITKNNNEATLSILDKDTSQPLSLETPGTYQLFVSATCQNTTSTQTFNLTVKNEYVFDINEDYSTLASNVKKFSADTVVKVTGECSDNDSLTNVANQLGQSQYPLTLNLSGLTGDAIKSFETKFSDVPISSFIFPAETEDVVMGGIFPNPGENLLVTLTLPVALTYFSGHALYGSLSLEKIIVPEENTHFTTVKNGTILIHLDHPSDGKTCTAAVACAPSMITALDFSDTDLQDVTYVDSGAFNLSSVKTITSFGNVAEIGNESFNSCPLESITLDGVKKIGRYAFLGCENLTEVTLPASLTELDANAFFKCNNITKFNIAAENPHYSTLKDGKFIVKDSNTIVTAVAYSSIDFSDTDFNNITTIGEDAFYQSTTLTFTSLGNITTIGKAAFNEARINFGDLVIPESTVIIACNAFATNTIDTITLENSETWYKITPSDDISEQDVYDFIAKKPNAAAVEQFGNYEKLVNDNTTTVAEKIKNIFEYIDQSQPSGYLYRCAE